MFGSYNVCDVRMYVVQAVLHNMHRIWKKEKGKIAKRCWWCAYLMQALEFISMANVAKRTDLWCFGWCWLLVLLLLFAFSFFGTHFSFLAPIFTLAFERVCCLCVFFTKCESDSARKMDVYFIKVLYFNVKKLITFLVCQRKFSPVYFVWVRLVRVESCS